MPMRKWQVKYRLNPNTGYLTKIVEAPSQLEAKRVFQAEIPSGVISSINPIR